MNIYEFKTSNTMELITELDLKGKSWLKTIVSFSNTAGGRVFVGIELNPLRIVGVKESRSILEKFVEDSIIEGIEPVPVFSLYYRNIENMEVLVVEVSRGNKTPYYIKDKGIEAGTYDRFGGKDIIAPQPFIDELILKGRNKVFSNKIYRIGR